MSLPLPPFLRRHGFLLIFAGLLTVSFVVHSIYRQRYVGAVDWYGYHQEAILLKAGRTTLSTELPAKEYPSVVPLGFSVMPDGRAVPQYPPGFPVLLAIGDVFGGMSFVPPLVGLASCLILFVLIKNLTNDRLTAALFAVVWAYFPIVVFGSTTVMSDLVAALFLLLSYWLYRCDRLFWSACALGFAFSVRPTNVLYLLAFGFVLLRDRKLIRYGLYLVLPCAIYAFYNHVTFGAPWRTGYLDMRSAFTTAVFAPQLAFYSWQIFIQFGPLVLLLVLVGLRQPRAPRLFLAAWFAIFLLFYAFYTGGATDRWWWTRFLLPGFGPLFMLAAIGFSRVRTWIDAQFASHPRRIGLQVALFALIAAMPAYYVWFGFYQRDLWSTNKGVAYHDVVQTVEKTVPAGSYIGSVEFTGAFRLYSQLGSYVSVNDNATKLVDHVLATGRAAYLIVEPWNKNDRVVQLLLTRYGAMQVSELKVWGGLPLYRLEKPAAP